MTKSQATKIYLKNKVCAKVIINRLQKWNPKLTIPQNSKILNITNDHAARMAGEFGLKYKPIYFKDKKSCQS